MAKRIVPIYSEITDSSAEIFESEINDAARFGEDLEVRVSTVKKNIKQK